MRIFPDANDDSNYKDVWYAQGSQGKAWSAKSAPIGKRPAGFKVSMLATKPTGLDVPGMVCRSCVMGEVRG